MTESGGLYAYYKSFNRLISELGVGALSNEVQVNYFIAGLLYANAVQNTNLTLHMHTFFINKPTSTITDLYAEADKVISLSKTNGGFNGNGKRAGTERGAPRSHQRDSFKQHRPSNGNNVSQPRGTSFTQRPPPSTSMKDVVCNKCQHKRHVAKNCTAAYTKSGKFIGVGDPPLFHYWTKRHADEAKAKKAAMVKTPPQQLQQHQQQQYQQQQQQQQKQKRKKTIGAITLAEPLAPAVFAPILDSMEGSDISEFSSCEDYLDKSCERTSLSAAQRGVFRHRPPTLGSSSLLWIT
jgi:hypothetical protein